jgi:hypothetical protein
MNYILVLLDCDLTANYASEICFDIRPKRPMPGPDPKRFPRADK